MTAWTTIGIRDWIRGGVEGALAVARFPACFLGLGLIPVFIVAFLVGGYIRQVARELAGLDR